MCVGLGGCFGEEAGARNLAFFRVQWLQPAMKCTSFFRVPRVQRSDFEAAPSHAVARTSSVFGKSINRCRIIMASTLCKLCIVQSSTGKCLVQAL